MLELKVEWRETFIESIEAKWELGNDLQYQG